MTNDELTETLKSLDLGDRMIIAANSFITGPGIYGASQNIVELAMVLTMLMSIEEKMEFCRFLMNSANQLASTIERPADASLQ